MVLVQPVRANEVFFTLPERVLAGVLADGHVCLDIGVLVGQKKPGELLRCVCCWATTEAHVDAFLASVRTHASSIPATKGPSGGGSLRVATSGGDVAPVATAPDASEPVAKAEDDAMHAATLQGRNPERGVEPWPGLAAVPLGTKTTFAHPIDDATDTKFSMPIFCVRGAVDGPTVLMLAGVCSNVVPMLYCFFLI